MRKALIVTLAVLALAGCKKEAPAQGAAAESEVEAALQGGGLPQPMAGLYRSTVELVSLESPGMPAGIVEQMKQAMASKGTSNEFCLTGAEAEKGYEERVKKLAGKPDCAFDRYSAQGGKLDTQLTCKGEGGAKAVVTMQGTMRPNGSDVTLTAAQTGSQMPGGSMKMTMKVRSERVGDCKS